MSSNAVVDSRPHYQLVADQFGDNPGQRQAYNVVGNCAILAGPGSGKTKVLTVKMARMLAEEYLPPRGVACISFNNECVRELKQRLDQLGVSQKRNVYIGTVHSFCLEAVALPYARLAGLSMPDPLEVASPDDQQTAFESALTHSIGFNEDPREWKPRFDNFRRTYPDTDSKEYPADSELAELLAAYLGILRSQGQIDFDDMVSYGLRLVEHNDWVRRALRARFPAIVVDEYQDLGLPLHRIVVSLMEAGIRIVAVGDPDQSIYGFNGAHPQLLRELGSREDVTEVALRFNYRCGDTIVRASQRVMSTAREFESRSGYDGTIDFHECERGLPDQAERITSLIIPTVLVRGTASDLGGIAVLYPNRYVGDVVATSLDEAGYTFVRNDSGALYRRNRLTTWIENCAKWCDRGWQDGFPRLSELVRVWLSFFRLVPNDDEVHRLKLRFLHFLNSHKDFTGPIRNWMYDLHDACVFTAIADGCLMSDEQVEYNKLREACRQDGSLHDSDLTTLAAGGGSPDHINLFTLHSAKGMEFDVVVMLGMDAGIIPRWKPSAAEVEESRRLFYVGLTRARHEIHVLYSGYTVDRYGRHHHDGPCPFVLDVRAATEAGERMA